MKQSKIIALSAILFGIVAQNSWGNCPLPTSNYIICGNPNYPNSKVIAGIDNQNIIWQDIYTSCDAGLPVRGFIKATAENKSSNTMIWCFYTGYKQGVTVGLGQYDNFSVMLAHPDQWVLDSTGRYTCTTDCGFTLK